MHPTRSIAASLLVLLVSGAAPFAAAPEGTPERVSANLLYGRVLRDGAKQPVGGATVRLYHRTTGRQYSTVSNTETGSYLFTELPDGSYEFSVETSEGRFFAADPVALAGGIRTLRSFSLSRDALPPEVRARLEREGLGDLVPGRVARAVNESGQPPPGGKTARNTAIVLSSVGSGYLLYELLEDEEVSPSAP